MSPADKKQLKQNLVMFAKAHKYLKGKGLAAIYANDYQLSPEVFDELFSGQFQKKEGFNDEKDEHSITMGGYTFSALFKKE